MEFLYLRRKLDKLSMDQNLAFWRVRITTTTTSLILWEDWERKERRGMGGRIICACIDFREEK